MQKHVNIEVVEIKLNKSEKNMFKRSVKAVESLVTSVKNLEKKLAKIKN